MTSAFSRQMWNSKTVSVLPAPREIAGRSMDGNFSAGKVLAVQIRNSKTVSVLPAPREIAGRSMDGNFSAGKVLAVQIRNSRLERKEHGI